MHRWSHWLLVCLICIISPLPLTHQTSRVTHPLDRTKLNHSLDELEVNLADLRRWPYPNHIAGTKDWSAASYSNVGAGGASATSNHQGITNINTTPTRNPLAITYHPPTRATEAGNPCQPTTGYSQTNATAAKKPRQPGKERDPHQQGRKTGASPQPTCCSHHDLHQHLQQDPTADQSNKGSCEGLQEHRIGNNKSRSRHRSGRKKK